MNNLYKLLAIVLLALPLKGLAQCDLPLPFEGNTGFNMTVLLAPPFIQSLNVVDAEAYLIGYVLVDNVPTVIASRNVGPAYLNSGQTSIAIWGDDTVTPLQDGALNNQTVIFQLVDGESLYDIEMPSTVMFSGNEMSVQNVNAVVTLNCEPEDQGALPECDYPSVFVGNTGSNMTVMLTSAFFSTITLTNEAAYIAAISTNSIIVGSAPLYGLTQTSLAIWGDDTSTPEIDGALANEAISFQIVDGTNLYDLTMPTSVSFLANGLSVQVASPTIVAFNCGSDLLLGCMDVTACNYNANANEEDNSCTFAEENYDCDGLCIANCPEIEIFGCTYEWAGNYDSSANTDDGTCTLSACTSTWADNYDTNATADDGSCYLNGCTSTWADNYDANATSNDGSCVLEGCTSNWAQNYDFNATSDDGSCYLNGCTSTWADNYNSNVTSDDGSCILFACTSNWADNYVANATNDDGSCILEACTLSWADNYDSNATIDDGSCFRVGCTNIVATNYDGLATQDDNSCLIEGCMNSLANNYNNEANVPTYCAFLGCTDTLACNLLSIANEDDGSCTLPIEFYNCNGDCLSDIDEDGICDELEVLGCQSVSADNYNYLATDAGICIYLGCMDEFATNYDSNANTSNNTCYLEGCMNPSALNYDEFATLNNENLCVYSVSSLPCVLPNEYSGLITGSNMNVLFTSNFSVNLSINSPQAYIVAMTPNNSIVGSTNIQQSMVSSITIWGDDSQTENIDGALSWEQISFYLVDGNNYFHLDLSENVNYTENQTLVVNTLSDVQTLCLNGALTQITILGCTDPTAFNYINPVGNESIDVNTEDGTCIYSDQNNCVFPSLYTGGITGSNMSLLFTQDFMNSLPNLQESAYIVALNAGNIVFGSELIAGADITALTIWGDDSGTLALDGAAESEELNLYLVNGTNLYDLIPYQNLSYSNNSMLIFNEDASITSLCSNGLVVFMEGCTDSEASNFNPLATDDDASCVYEGCTYDAFYEFDANASIEDQSCENVIITGCTDILFVEYNSIATEDNGSCVYSIARILELENIEYLYYELGAENDALVSLVAPIPIDLFQGWNIIGYNLNYPQNTAACFDAVSENIVVAKNNRGLIYWPEIGYNGIGDLVPGQGYQIFMSGEVDDFSFIDVSDLRVDLSPTIPQWMIETTPIHPNDIRTLARVVNMLGQVVDPATQLKGEVLLYLYNDGTVEKIIK